MPRKRPTPAPSALSNALLAATIAELPLPNKGNFPASDREAWITMLRGAMDVVYGPVERPPTMTYRASDGSASEVPLPPQLAAAAVAASTRYYVDDDSSAVMCGSKPVKFHGGIPPGSILWDERTMPDRGHNLDLPPMMGLTDNLDWADIGTNPKGELPPGVTMRPWVRTVADDGVTSWGVT